MREQGYITAAEEQAARAGRGRASSPTASRATCAGAYAKEYLRQQFRDQFGGDHPPDWQVHTTFQPDVQDAAERAVADGLRRLDARGLQAALVAIDPATGDLLAMVGGADFATSTFNRATRSRRQPGSAFKPIVYAAALVARLLAGVGRLGPRRVCRRRGDPEWTPRNAENRAGGRADAARGAHRVEQRAPPSSCSSASARAPCCGWRATPACADLPDVPSLALGTGLVTPLELTGAYTMFPNGGRRGAPRGIAERDSTRTATRCFDAGRRPRARHQSPQVAFQMVSMLRDVVDRGTGTAARAWGVRGAGRRQDGHDQRLSRTPGSSASRRRSWRRVGGLRPAGADRARGVRRARGAADLGRFHAAHRPDASGARLRCRRPPCAPSRCAASRTSGPLQGCPVYTEYFKDGDEVPSALCPVHQGTLKERATRAVMGFFHDLGSRIAGLFHRRSR